ncbi:MAG TPA: metal-dependent hydrolase [Vicinamibacterales bacterium]|jgi:inner membrane protein|nr:metal-dependent hydrolase [Vicinamibacterales bacterium]
MASVISHAVFASGLGAAASPGARMPARYWVTVAIIAALPDLDVVVYPLGLNAPHMLGHRGITHSLPFAAVFAALVVRLVFRDAAWRLMWGRLWAVFFVAMASHGILDAMTNGGQGIAFFAPFSGARWHFPWQPILVSPIGVGAFFSRYGLRVLQNELLSVWLPAALMAAGAWYVRRSRTERSRPVIGP